jgi:glucose-6-phosphate isomerase
MTRENLIEYLKSNPKIEYKGKGQFNGYNIYLYDHCDDDFYFFSYSYSGATQNVKLRFNFVKKLLKLNQVSAKLTRIVY